jgi:DNA adenine methylase
MKYVGSKNRHAKELLSIILKNRTKDQWYVEPFCGGFNLIDKVDGNRIANDKHFYLIELFKAIQKGWQPPDNISFEEYDDIRKNKENYSSCLVGFVGFGCSFSGKFFGGYARGNQSNGNPRNYCLESKRNILKQHNGLQGINIFNLDYWSLEIPNNSIIYCDPPYQDTTKYTIGKSFDYDDFWKWCEQKTREGHKVFVSEYNAPEGWKCIWKKEVHNSLDLDTGSKNGIEKLFVYEN